MIGNLLLGDVNGLLEVHEPVQRGKAFILFVRVTELVGRGLYSHSKIFQSSLAKFFHFLSNSQLQYDGVFQSFEFVTLSSLLGPEPFDLPRDERNALLEGIEELSFELFESVGLSGWWWLVMFLLQELVELLGVAFNNEFEVYGEVAGCSGNPLYEFWGVQWH